MFKSGVVAQLGQSQALHRRILRRLGRMATGARGFVFERLVGTNALRTRDNAAEDLLFRLDALLSDSSDIVSGVAFAIYRKRVDQAD